MEQKERKSDASAVRFAAICGMVAPFALASAVLIAGALRPGYDHTMQFISALGEEGDASSYVMNFGGFFLFGTLLIMFAYGFFRRTEYKGIGSMVSYAETLKLLSPILIVISGFGYMSAAFFTGVTAVMHGVAGFFAGLIWSLPLITAYSFRHDRRWRNFWIISLGVFISQVIVGVVFRLSFTDMIGLAQRVGYVPILVWIEAASIYLLLLARPEN